MGIVPPKLFQASTGNSTLYALYQERNGMEPADRALYHPDQAELLGTFLPPFQRPVVWTEAQQIRFVESAYHGFHLGTYVVNNTQTATELVGDRRLYLRTDLWLIDGQQRLTALKNYWNDGFRIFQEKDGGFLWSETDAVEKRMFLMTGFPRSEINVSDEYTLRLLYDRLNFGGTPHTQEQRALPDPENDTDSPTP